jgi:pyruvate formate lyase activating enzyme
VSATSSLMPRQRAEAERLHIGGFVHLSAVDWPGELAAVIFCQGCGWRCGYCHNPHLIPFASPSHPIAWEHVLSFLTRRRGLLDGVVFSGGEPTLQPGLTAGVTAVRTLGFKVGLHTGGPVPETLRSLLPMLDWVGFDFKAPFDRYLQVTGQDHGPRARESLKHLLTSGVAYEIRTTWHPRLLSASDLGAMARTLGEAGCREWIIQRFRPDGCADASLAEDPIGEVPLSAVTIPGLRVVVR